MHNSSHAHAGGSARVRRLLFGAVVSLSIFLPGAHPAARVDPEPSTQVSVREERGLYAVTARFDVPQTAPMAFAALTDYEQIPRFMPEVRTSIVRERFPGGVIVEQEAVARMMVFSKRIHLLLEVRAEGDTVRFRDCSGRSFARYEGAWRLATHNGRTVITYELSARPSFDVPEFLLTRLLRRDARQMIEHLRAEIAARSLQMVNRP
jgi:ribosome-associated toxin RatA of RatAB toxin-antitoxin module